jgi:hypothetical protein
VLSLASASGSALTPRNCPFLPPPHSQTEQKYFYKQRIFFMSYQIVRDAGKEGTWQGVGCGALSQDTA